MDYEPGAIPWRNDERGSQQVASGHTGSPVPPDTAGSQTSDTLSAGGGLAAAGAVCLLVALLLPWAEVMSGLGGTTPVAGSSLRIEGVDWFFRPLIGLPASALLLGAEAHSLLIEKKPLEGWYSFAPPLVAAAVTIINATKINDLIADIPFVVGGARLGPGVWVAGAGVLLGLLGVILGRSAEANGANA